MTVNGRLLAQFLEKMATDEEVLIQQQHDLEEQSIRDAILGKKTIEVVERREERDEVKLDLALIPRYEEYC